MTEILKIDKKGNIKIINVKELIDLHKLINCKEENLNLIHTFKYKNNYFELMANNSNNKNNNKNLYNFNKKINVYGTCIVLQKKIIIILILI